jgi:dipeptidyl aminopeptidase/acylaminoacyl peptidase
MMRHVRELILAAVFAATAPAIAATMPPGLEAALSYPFEQDLVSAESGDTIAWVQVVRGVRNIWVARGPAFTPRQITHNSADDGQELSGLAFSPDGTRLVWARGGDHDANWPANGGLEPDPAADPTEPKVTIWTALVAGGEPVKVTEGDEPTISADGVLAYVKDHQVWTTSLDGKATPERLFFDRGHVGELVWSPRGDRLAFVSDRGDHAFVGVFTAKDQPIVYLAPTTDRAGSPRWSPDATSIAFVRVRGGSAWPESMMADAPEPWSIWTAPADGGDAALVWKSPKTPDGSFPDTDGEANLFWMAGGKLAFLADLDGWPHLYSVPAGGGEPTLLTPGAFTVEHVTRSHDGRSLIYAANTGGTKDDSERRHIFEVGVGGGAPVALTSGTTIDWTPAAMHDAIAYIAAGYSAPPEVAVVGLNGKDRREIAAGDAASGFSTAAMVEPRAVTFTAPDGLTVHGQLFQAPGGGTKPGVIFVHGGPPRQMLLGWHYMDYYSNSYAVNQYLAAHGFTVLSVNYRLGIGYGRAYKHPAHAGPTGASEYQDVLAGAKYLQTVPDVDPKRIGIWGGSYGGLLTAQALARNSDVFKAGVDWHGVHDWTRELHKEMDGQPRGYDPGAEDKAMAVAFASSPEADVAKWTSPVLLIQGDDDRNVLFAQTVDLARKLEDRGVTVEELVIPNEIHGFLQHRSWVAADAATVDFLDRKLGVSAK